jgi:hypothetical protein
MGFLCGLLFASPTLPNPLKEISTHDLHGTMVLTGIVNSHTFHMASSSEWLLHYIFKNLMVFYLVT